MKLVALPFLVLIGVPGVVMAQEGPPPMSSHVMTYHGGLGMTVMFGALVDGEPDGATWIRNAAGQWQRFDTPGPSPRNVHAMAWDPDRDRIVLYGGIGTDGKLGDLWEFDGSTWEVRWRNSTQPASGNQ